MPMKQATSISIHWGANVRSLRLARGLTVVRLARLADIDQGSLSRLENGLINASEETRARVAKALGVEVGAIWNYPKSKKVAS